MKKKIAALALIVILIVNIVLFALGISSELVFWTVIIAAALIAYFGFKKENINKK